MPDSANIPYLLKLFDDDSDSIRAKISAELKKYGRKLETEISKADITLNYAQQILLDKIIKENRIDILLSKWEEWINSEESELKLEQGFFLLTEYYNGTEKSFEFRSVLDRFAAEYNALYDEADVMSLARFLFYIQDFKGVEHDYFSPANSDLLTVLNNKKGIPLSLAAIYIFIGRRVGLTIHGCNLPGHFFARVEYKGSTYLVDCFNRGLFLPIQELPLKTFSPFLDIQHHVENAPDSLAVISRVLINFENAYQRHDNNIEAAFYTDLNTLVRRRIENK